MLLRDRAKILLMFFCVAMLTACSNTKHLPPGDRLYKGSKVIINDKVVEKKNRKVLVNNLVAVVRPKPNSTLLGMRIKLSLYNAAGDTKKKRGLRQWIRNKVGEPPALISSVRLNTNRDLMVNMLQNMGYFTAAVTAAVDTDKHKRTTVVFKVTTGPQYTISKSYFVGDSSLISRYIDSGFSKTLLKPGAAYNLDLIKAERTRIDQGLKQKGYFYFKPDYIIDVVDSSIGDHKVNMFVRLKRNSIPDEARNTYTINNIYIYADYKLLGAKQDTDKANRVAVGNYFVIDESHSFNPSLFARLMIFEKGDVYNVDDQNTSLSRLVNIGNFKFVKSRFEPVTDSLLDVFYYLTPYPKRAIGFQTGVLTQNDNRAGIDGSLTLRNRNAFKGGEVLLLKISGGFNAQYSGIDHQPDIYHFGVETDLSFPRFEIPFINIQTGTRYLPRTILKLKYNYESESDLLRINSYTASYGYDWKHNAHIEHQLYPLNITYVKTDTFDRSKVDQLYGGLVFNGIIVGPTYEFTYNSQVGLPRKHSFYFDGLVDLSGNILGLAEKADYATNPQTLFGTTYAQYLKFQPDFRYYLRFSSSTTIASRIMAGVGVPYGNSNELPNIKGFWAGGNSDLRGFPSRLVGPGTFNAYTNTNGTSYIETLGDLKFECNVELRQQLYKFIGLGVFADGGNIWLYHNNPGLPGGAFSSDFYKELAINVGLGLRFDFKILILRLDLGMPVHDPWLPENSRWVINKIEPEDPTWKRNNLVFNLAIGYPF
jgi:outer membrane protein insertion porin family